MISMNWQKRKRQEGSLTIEATIVLTAYLFFMMFLMNMGQIYRAQNYVTHGMLQSGQMLAFASYEFGEDTTISQFGDLFLLVCGQTDAMIKDAWKSGNYSEAAAHAFAYCAGSSPAEVDRFLKEYGVSSGRQAIDFSKTSKSEEDLILRAQYTVDLPFAFFNISKIEMHQQVVCGLWEK